MYRLFQKYLVRHITLSLFLFSGAHVCPSSYRCTAELIFMLYYFFSVSVAPTAMSDHVAMTFSWYCIFLPYFVDNEEYQRVQERSWTIRCLVSMYGHGTPEWLWKWTRQAGNGRTAHLKRKEGTVSMKSITIIKTLKTYTHKSCIGPRMIWYGIYAGEHI